MHSFWCFIYLCFITEIVHCADPICGTNSVGFDYGTLPKLRSKRIVGGTITTPHAFPWMASVQHHGIHWCGGSLMRGSTGRYFVLTGAHCMHGILASDMEVKLGVHDLSKTEPSAETVPIKTHMTHPQFNPTTLEYDMGLLELAHAPQIQRPEINTACLALAESTPGEIAYVIGWGTTSAESAPSDFLQVVEKPVMSPANCSTIYGTDFHSGSMICAGFPEGGKDSCRFDSGGPLMHYRNNRMEVIGTVSWGYGCAQPNSPAVYSKLYSGLQWISHTINA